MDEIQVTIKAPTIAHNLIWVVNCTLWIIDDWGVISMNRDVAEEVFDLLDRRKYHAAMILTSNRDIEEWAEVFPDSVLASSTIDRMFEQAETIIFKGASYRLKGRIVTREIDRHRENT